MAEPEKYWTKDDFMEHVHKELNWARIDSDGITRDRYPISDADSPDLGCPGGWIFWSREQDDPDPLLTLPYDNLGFISHSPNNLTVKDKVRLAIRKLLLPRSTLETLVQFWAATTTLDGRTLLTTQDQPFGFTKFSNRLCEYRMISMDYTFYVDGRNGEEELGIPGRVYLNKYPECTPDVEYYSVKEHPQRNRALRCGVGQSWTLPVIEHSTQMCVGVLELVGGYWLCHDLDSRVHAAFQGLGLQCIDSCEHHETREKNDNDAHKAAFNEIERVLKLVCEIHKIPLALTLVPCSACETLFPIKDLCMFRDHDDVTIHNLRQFSMGRLGHHLRNRIGVVGRALSSPNLLLCPDVTQFNMAEYPLSPFIRQCKLRGCFTMSLQSDYTGNDVYVLEIFLPARNRDEDLLTSLRMVVEAKKEFKTKILLPANKDEDPLISLSKILETMKKEFKTFSLASGEVLGKELSVEVIEFQNGQKRHYVKKLQVTGSLPSQCEIELNLPQELVTRKTSGRKHKIPYDVIMHYSKLRLSDAAKNLQVSVSTLQRVCRQYGISRWPPQPSHVDHQEEVPQLNSNLLSNQASASIAHTQPYDTEMQNADTVNVKAKYVKGLPVLFPLPLSSTLEELYECIETRLHLSRATYLVCYIDGDNDKIEITCDQDLQFWLNNSPRSPGSNAVVLHIDPINQVHHTKSVSPVSYIDCFPASLRPFIRHVKDVALDGNCGFRAIAGLMDIGEDGWVQVRRDLLNELNSHVDEYNIMYGGHQRINELTHCLSWFDGPAGMDRWMTMPDMGHLIASCYNVVLYLLSHQQCLTFLPLRSMPIPAASRREITIGFVNNNHFVEVFLLPGHPAPPVASKWMRYRYGCAQGWDTAYNRRIQHFRELVDHNVVATTDAICLD